jgi:hypothetical protein
MAHSHPPPRRIANIAREVLSTSRPVTVDVNTRHHGRNFASGAVGLSIEADDLVSRYFSAKSRSLVTLMRLLGPGVLRLGGNSLDYSWWTSQNEQPPAWAKSVVTPLDLIRLRGLLLAAHWRVILGVDLGHFDPDRAANEALVAKRILGARLLGIEIGNEPNNYANPVVKLRSSTYDASDYLTELSDYSRAISASAGAIPLYGPDLFSPEWMRLIASSTYRPFAVLSWHYYPTAYSIALGACESTPTPTALGLLSLQDRERESAVLREIARDGQIAHRATAISETNTTSSCDVDGGPDTSPVFASALWSLDWVLRAASAGVTRLNFHGYFGLCSPSTFSPVCAPSDAAATHGQVVARPEYYGLLAARKLEGGHFLPVNILETNASGNLTVYATAHPGGVITLAIENFTTSSVIPLILRVPGYVEASEESLTSPSINATKNITLGGSSFSAAGTIKSTTATIPKLRSDFRFDIGPASAMIISVRR